MSLSNLIVLKLVAFIICDNFLLKFIVIAFLFFDIFRSKKQLIRKNLKDYFCGVCLVLFNSVLSVSFFASNFIVLGISSSLFYKLKMERYLELYFVILFLEGVVFFCLSF